jgi:hypothetical protein
MTTFDLFKTIQAINEIPKQDTGEKDIVEEKVTKNTALPETFKFKLLTASLCSCVMAYAQFNDQQNPSNPQETLRKTLSFCDKLMSENLLSQDDGETVMQEVRAMVPLTKPSLCKRMVANFCKMFKKYTPSLFDDGTDTKIKEEYDGKIDNVVNNAVNKAVVLCGNKNFAKYLGIDQVEQEAVYK